MMFAHLKKGFLTSKTRSPKPKRPNQSMSVQIPHFADKVNLELVLSKRSHRILHAQLVRQRIAVFVLEYGVHKGLVDVRCMIEGISELPAGHFLHAASSAQYVDHPSKWPLPDRADYQFHPNGQLVKISDWYNRVSVHPKYMTPYWKHHVRNWQLIGTPEEPRFPPGIETMSKLETIYFAAKMIARDNPIQRICHSIPTQIQDLKNIRELSFPHSNIQDEFPPWIGKLHHLEIFCCCNNPDMTGTIPSSIQQCTKLRKLCLSLIHI